MKNTLSILFFALFFSFSIISVSQETTTLAPHEYFTMHYYTFGGNNVGQDRLDALEQSLSKLEFVSEAKVKYKNEKNMGQIVLVVKEREMVQEGDKTFSPATIKQTIMKNGFSPMDHSIGAYERK